MRPTWRFLGALVLGGVIYFFGAGSQVTWLFLIAFLVWAVALVAYPYARWNDHRLRGSVRVAEAHGPAEPLQILPAGLIRAGPARPLFEGDTVTVELELRVVGEAPRGPARLSGQVGRTTVSAGTGLVPPGGWRRRRRLPPLARGTLVGRSMRLETGDPLGFFAARRQLADQEIAVAYPLFTSLRRRVAERDVESELTRPAAGSGAEFRSLREYRPGDSTRRIHWPSSARVGQLMAREDEPPGTPTVSVLIDPTPPTPEAADQVARIAASEVWDCLRVGGCASLWSPGHQSAGPVERGSLWVLLEWLALYPRLPAGDADPPRSPQLVVIACSIESPVLKALDERRHPAGQARVWLVGQSAARHHLAVPTETVGTNWPLA